MRTSAFSSSVLAVLVLSCLGSTAEGAKKGPPTNTSIVIPSAGEADLWEGNGDVSPKGPCKQDITKFCKDVGAGEGRIAACLTKRVRSSRLGNVAGGSVGAKCAENLISFKMDRSSNINKDVPLATACKDDKEKLCPKESDVKRPGSVMSCLRTKKQKITSAQCNAQLFQRMIEAVEDYRTDYLLYKACKDDVANLCDDIDPGFSKELQCLAQKRIQVSWECQDRMFVNEKVSEDDIRLHVRLFSKCNGDWKKYCKDVEPGAMRVQECLEDNMEESDFSEDCKEELEATIAKRVADFRLDEPLRDSCESEIERLCGLSLEQMDSGEEVKQRGLNCLQQFREEIKEEKCKQEVHRRMERMSRDIRFDDVLAKACAADRESFCQDISPGSARVIRCLQEHRTSLQQTCAAALFDHEVKMAEDIDFKYPLKRACSWEIKSFCKDIPDGHARVIRCLEERMDDDDMSKECKSEVMKDMNRMATDFRLNYRLKTACTEDIQALCPNPCITTPGQSCGGLVLQCLQDQSDNITHEACQEEVFFYELMEVSDFRNDVMLAEACREDVDKYCMDVEPGEGRVHTCLRFNRDKISPRCLKEELKLQTIEAKDIRLRPKLDKLCSEEKAVFCKDVKPGNGRVVKCLIENMGDTNFGDECQSELEKREDQMKSDYRYDIGVVNNCATDIDQYCAEETTKLRGTASVLKCLAANFRSLTDACQSEMSRAVRLALWDYKVGAPLTAMCDSAVESMCPKNAGSKGGNMFTIGVVGRCLSKALVQGKSMDLKCRNMVLVAAPKDARAYFEYPESTSAIVAKIAEMQKMAGLDGALVDPYQRSGSMVTVTGWVALSCIISLVVVLVGGAVMLYRRYIGEDKPHTMHVKMGDA